MKKMF